MQLLLLLVRGGRLKQAELCLAISDSSPQGGIWCNNKIQIGAKFDVCTKQMALFNNAELFSSHDDYEKVDSKLGHTPVWMFRQKKEFQVKGMLKWRTDSAIHKLG